MPQKTWLVLWLVVFVLLFVWRIQNLDAFGLSNDEGAHLMWAQLAVEGYPLYGETYAVQAPLFLEPVGWAFRLAGSTIQAGRWVVLAGFGLLAVAVSWLAYRVGGWPAALMAVLLAGISPLIFTFSRLVIAEVPATGLAVSSVVLLFIYVDRNHRGWLIISGLALGLSFITKALNPFVVVPVGIILILRYRQSQTGQVSTTGVRAWFASFRKQWQLLLADSVWWGIGLLLPIVTIFLIYDPAGVYDQLIAFRGDLRTAIPGSWTETWANFQIFLGDHWGFGLLAFGGIISTVLRLYVKLDGLGKSGEFTSQNLPNPKDTHNSLNSVALYNLIWGAWLIAGVAMLAVHTPLFPHHFIVLLPPLILLAVSLVTNLANLWPKPGHHGLMAYGSVAVLLSTVIGATCNGPALVKANQHTAAIVTGGREQEALQLLEAVTNPNDFVMGDSQLLIFMASRRTPPPLGDVALVAIKAGRQTSARMIGLTEAYQSPAVVQWSLRLPWLPEYLAWVEANYLTRRVWDNDHIIYFGRRIPAGQIMPNERLTRLGASIALRGYELDPNSIKPGQDLQLKVYWQTEVPVTRDYTIFTQLLNSSGVLVVSQDSRPLGGYLPTRQWPANEMVTDIVRLPLPIDLPAGVYTLITGMYVLETLERLPVMDDGRDYLNLTTIEIK
jgi:4-amino-4-deoxy-L-arabinose transferase-like glycosyltransferase